MEKKNNREGMAHVVVERSTAGGGAGVVVAAGVGRGGCGVVGRQRQAEAETQRQTLLGQVVHVARRRRAAADALVGLALAGVGHETGQRHLGAGASSAVAAAADDDDAAAADGVVDVDDDDAAASRDRRCLSRKEMVRATGT